LFRWFSDYPVLTAGSHNDYIGFHRIYSIGVYHMTSVTFDTPKHAEAQNKLVTRDDLEIALSPLKTDLAVLKWMIGILIAGVMSIVIKTFFS